MFKFILYKIGQFIVNWLPLPLSYRYALFVSDLHYLFSFRDRRAVRNNLRTIFKTNKNFSIETREVFRNFGRYLLEFFRMSKRLDQKFIQKNVTVKNQEIVDRVLQGGKGGIILTAHLGNWELGGAVISMLGYPMVVIALAHKERRVNDLFNQQRQAKGVAVVPSHLAVRRVIEALRNNKLVAVVADRDFNFNGVILDFLGRKAMIPKGAAIFTLKTGAPIIPSFFLRNPDNTFTLSFEEPFMPPVPPLSSQETIDQELLLKVMRQYTTLIEERIRQHPTQWLMFRQFWIN